MLAPRWGPYSPPAPVFLGPAVPVGQQPQLTYNNNENCITKSSNIWHRAECYTHFISVMRVGLHFPDSSSSKESTCNTEDEGLIPGSGRSPGGGNGNPLQYSWLENPMDRGAWWAIVHGVAKSQTPLSDWTRTRSFNKWLSQAYCVPGTLLCTRGTSMGRKKRLSHGTHIHFCCCFPHLALMHQKHSNH